MAPIARELAGCTYPAAGVIATNPTTAPQAPPIPVTCFYLKRVSNCRFLCGFCVNDTLTIESNITQTIKAVPVAISALYVKTNRRKVSNLDTEKNDYKDTSISKSNSCQTTRSQSTSCIESEPTEPLQTNPLSASKTRFASLLLC